jgi:ATP-dependent DNA helicase RecG
MTLYADMDVSVIDELPRGRQPIDSRLIGENRKEEVIEWLGGELAAGRQAYWVCPLIEDSEQVPAASVTAAFEHLTAALPEAAIGVLHGRLKSEEKAEVMQAFKSGALSLLIATTVVEVGVDVPNASIMVIESPERLGLSQLHQLRGRVGRGTTRSQCLLIYRGKLAETSRKRLQVIRDSQDGFEIAEQDLTLRGPGDLLGARQTGEQEFRIADLRSHAHLIAEVTRRGDEILESAPEVAARLLNIWAPADTGHISV